MPKLIAAPASSRPPGRNQNGSKNSARMMSPGGWAEPGQRPEFEEITVALRGMVRVEHEGGVMEIPAFSPESVHRDS
jgi:hypothetical protein